ncbi:hypothetical protein [Mycolicibacterium peregrinum]|uniref:Lipoprotein n=1 Tax=Mycolicibacterium peregrinum TaxID=43304 RepID=A0A1A0W007_MYCPR|nr:hypothetical protein [Mycolicibacterium peregrinum]OBB88895.1 hypothetical protein A5779_30090 [Mycolicibacterium peregrinum]
MTPQRVVAAILVCLTFVVSACNPTGDAPSGDATSDQIRHDLEPLTKRFPAIGHPISATWMGGTLGVQPDGRATVPGPSDYWIEAIIELEPATADALRSKYVPTATAEAPELTEKLQKDVPGGPFLTGPALDTALSNDDWRSTAYLHSGSNTLVMRSVDD